MLELQKATFEPLSIGFGEVNLFNDLLGRYLPPLDRGGVLEIIGGPCVGRTSVGLHLAGLWISGDERRVLVVDGGSVSNLHVNALGSAADKFEVYLPGNGDDALSSAVVALRSGKYGCLVLDDLPAFIPGDMDLNDDRAQSLMYLRLLPLVRIEALRNRALVILVNQLRSRLDFNAEYTACGRASRVLSDDRLLIQRGRDISWCNESGFEVFVRRLAVKPEVEGCIKLYLIYGRGLRFSEEEDSGIS
jgi:RecA/RadA recombinase